MIICETFLHTKFLSNSSSNKISTFKFSLRSTFNINLTRKTFLDELLIWPLTEIFPCSNVCAKVAFLVQIVQQFLHLKKTLSTIDKNRVEDWNFQTRFRLNAIPMGCDRGFWSWWRESLSDTKTWCYAISAEERKCECEMLSISTTMCFWYRYQCGVKKRTSRWTQIERIKFHEKKCTHEHATFTRIEFIFAFHWILNSHSMSSSVRVFFFLFFAFFSFHFTPRNNSIEYKKTRISRRYFDDPTIISLPSNLTITIIIIGKCSKFTDRLSS